MRQVPGTLVIAQVVNEARAFVVASAHVAFGQP